MQKHTLQPNKKMKRDFFLFKCLIKEKGKIPTRKNQEKQLWPNHRSQRINSTNHTLAILKNDSHTCLKTLKKSFL
jgi:hypothetical protein